jgi:C4-dicarboxylate transporter DctM subunit
VTSAIPTPDIDTPEGSLPVDSRSRGPNRRTLLIGFVPVAVCLIGVFSSPTVTIAGLWCIGLMLVLLVLSVPVALALAVPSLVGLYAVSGVPATINVLGSAPYAAVSSWSMSVVPMFIFMGMLLSMSGMASRVYDAAGYWFNWLPGGIGVGTTAAGAGLASVSGSTIGVSYALGRVGIPEMLRAGYDKRMAIGTILVAGLPGNLIPPSVLLVVYAGIASVPVGPQLMAGVVPGVLIAVFFGAFILATGVLAPHLVGRDRTATATAPPVTWKQRFVSLGRIWGLVVIMAVLFSGMFSGLFTPTEAGASAALVALLLTVFYTRKDGPVSTVTRAAFATVSASAAIFFILIGAEMLTRMMAITGLAQVMTDFITSFGLGRIGFLLVLVVFYLILGMFFETLSMMLLTIPILLPTLEVMGIDLLWFGVFVVLLGELAMVTPPVGLLSYVVHNLTKSADVNLGQDISLRDVFVAAGWFLPIAALFLVVMILVPDMTSWLPSLMR